MNLSKLIRTTAAALAVGVVLTGAAAAANVGGAIVTSDYLNLRTAGNNGAPILDVAPNGAGLIVTELNEDGWHKVWYKGTEGYMSSRYFRMVDTLDGNIGNGTVKGSNVRLRDDAGYTGATISYLNHGTTMGVIGVYGEWYKVSYNGKTGYVHSDYMSLTYGSLPEQSSATELGKQIADEALSYLGTPYVWAGTSPSGFDCSGLVYYAYASCGVSITRTAESIYSCGSYVEKAELQIGDTVHFTGRNSGGKIDHVGIYIGDDKFVHASSSSEGVIISELSSDYYTEHYYGARRIV